MNRCVVIENAEVDVLGGGGADFEDARVPEGWWGGVMRVVVVVVVGAGVVGAVEGDVGVEVEGCGVGGVGNCGLGGK